MDRIFAALLLLLLPLGGAQASTAQLGMTPGAGVTLICTVDGSGNYVCHNIVCDPTTTTQCLGVDASGRLTALSIQSGTWTVGVNGTLPAFAAPPTVNPQPTSAVTGSVHSESITASSSQILAGATRTFLAIDNESAVSIACAFGATAVVNGGGSFTVPSGATRIWNSYPVPADAVNCISSSGTVTVTFEYN